MLYLIRFSDHKLKIYYTLAIFKYMYVCLCVCVRGAYVCENTSVWGYLEARDQH